MTAAAKPRPTLRKAVKTALPPTIKLAFVSIPRFLDAGATLARMREKIPGVDFKAYADLFVSMEDWMKRRRKVIKEMDALIVAVGPKRNAPHGVVREIQAARQFEKPIYLFNTQTGLIEPFTGYRLFAFFPRIEDASDAHKAPSAGETMPLLND